MSILFQARIPNSSFKVFIVYVLSSWILTATNLNAAETGWMPPRTASGAPDLQGLWTYIYATPYQRPLELGDKRAYTEEEALAVEADSRESERVRTQPIDPDRGPPPLGDLQANAPDSSFRPESPTNVARVNGEYRTSLIIEPSDGRLPYLEEGMDIFEQWLAMGFGEFDGPEIRPASERCFVHGAPLPIMHPLVGINSQIVQTDEYVVILTEAAHQARIIRLDKEHQENSWNRWMGDSIGRWEGDTLVVHTRNFRPEQSSEMYWLKSSDALQITERFTIVSEDELAYSYVAIDPNIYSQSFTVEMPLHRMVEGERIYEYACHEGNYSLPGILAGARRQEIDNQR